VSIKITSWTYNKQGELCDERTQCYYDLETLRFNWEPFRDMFLNASKWKVYGEEYYVEKFGIITSGTLFKWVSEVVKRHERLEKLKAI
jgi:TPP-dependent indolepyruvate ferredoxin oxidoreductase alpha subunit